MDSEVYTVALVTIQAGDGPPLRLCDHYKALPVGGDIYLAAPSMEFKLAASGGGLDAEAGEIQKVPIGFTLISNLASQYPYNKVTITVTEAVMDASLSITAQYQLFQGLLYSSSSDQVSGFVDLKVRGWKYYTDITAGVPCTEQCAVAYFGDKICKAAVTSQTVQVVSVLGTSITIASTPPGVDYLYNRGYFSYGGVNLNIKYWKNGAVFQTSLPPPLDWVGKNIALVAGCDRTRESCRDIHNNEARFFGLGYSMVDYNAQAERY